MKKRMLSSLLALTLLTGAVVLPARAEGASQPSFPSVTSEQATAFLAMIETYSNLAPIYTNLGDIETTVHALVFDTGDGTPALLLAKGYGVSDPPALAEPGRVVYRLGEAEIFSFREGVLDPYFGNSPGSFTVYPNHIGVEFGTTDQTTYQEHRFSHLASGGGIVETADATFVRKLDERTGAFVYTIDGFGADEQLYQETLNGWLSAGTVASAVREGESRFVMTDVPLVDYTVERLKQAQSGESVAGVDLGPSWWAAQEVNAAVALGMVQGTMQGNWQAEITREEFARLAISFLAVQYGYGDRPLDVFMEDYLNRRYDLLTDDAQAFSDIETYPCADQINMACRLGIVKGRGDGRYDPEATITRQEAATLLGRAYQVYATLEQGEPSDPYTDQAQIAPWAAEGVAVLQSWDVLRGDETGAFHPLGKLTKEQAVAAFYRLYQNMPVSRSHGNLQPLFTLGEIAQQIRNDPHGKVKYEVETPTCTVIFMTYGGVMRPPSPAAYLVYPDSTYRRVEVPGNAENFRLAEGLGKLVFSTYEGEEYLLDLETASLTQISAAYANALLQASVTGFYHRPFAELPQALRDSLTWDGKVETMEGYHFRLRTYTGPGITVVTTEAPEDVLRDWIDLQLTWPVEQREEQATDEELEAEFQREKGREWLYSVTFTDDSYATDLGLRVGDTVEEAAEKGYPFDAEQLQAGETAFGVPMEIHLIATVENGVVTKLYLSFGIGRYVGKYWDI